MKALKIIGIIVVIVVATAVGGFMVQADVHVERSIDIAADNSVIVKQMTDFREFNEWSPWRDYDPNCKYEYSENQGEVGANYSWEGNEDVGKGSMTVKEITDSRITMDLFFIEPFESQSIAYFEFNDAEGGKKVTWGYDGQAPMLMNLFMDMDEMMGPDFEKGLGRLKERCESAKAEEPATDSNYQVEEIEMEAKTYIGKRSEISIEEMQGFYAENLPAIFEKIGAAGAQPGIPSGIYYKWDMENGVTDMAAAIPVTGDVQEIEGYETIEVSGKALKIAYMGGYDGIGAAHEAMDAYMTENGLEFNEMCIEEYATDPGAEPDTSKWLTNIYYMVK